VVLIVERFLQFLILLAFLLDQWSTRVGLQSGLVELNEVVVLLMNNNLWLILDLAVTISVIIYLEAVRTANSKLLYRIVTYFFFFIIGMVRFSISLSNLTLLGVI
jgi:hypothetical protein